MYAALIIGILVAAGFFGRAHGAATEDVQGKPTGWPSWGRIASVAFVSIVMAVTNFLTFNLWWLSLASAGLAMFGVSTGHGRFYAMTGANTNDPNPEWIEKYIASWAYPGDITKPAYSWFCMGVKGLMVGAGAAPFGLFLVALWPFSYYVSFRFWHDSPTAESASFVFATGLSVLTALAF